MFGFLDITRSPWGFERSRKQEIEPLDLPHLPITLPDLISRQKTPKNEKYKLRKNKKNIEKSTLLGDSRCFQVAIYTVFHEESESAVRIDQFLHPEEKIKKNLRSLYSLT